MEGAIADLHWASALMDHVSSLAAKFDKTLDDQCRRLEKS